MAWKSAKEIRNTDIKEEFKKYKGTTKPTKSAASDISAGWVPTPAVFETKTALPRASEISVSGWLPKASEGTKKKVSINLDTAPRTVFSTVNPTIQPKVNMTQSTAKDEKTRLYQTNDSLLSNDEIFRKYQYVLNDKEMDYATMRQAAKKGMAMAGKMVQRSPDMDTAKRAAQMQVDLQGKLKSAALTAGLLESMGGTIRDLTVRGVNKASPETGKAMQAQSEALKAQFQQAQANHPDYYTGGQVSSELAKMAALYSTAGKAAEETALKAAGALGARMSAATASDFAQKAYALAKYNPKIAAAAKFGTRMLGQQAADTAVLAPLVAADGIAEGKSRDEILKELAKQEAIAAGFNVGVNGLGVLGKFVGGKIKSGKAARDAARETATAAKNAKTTDFTAGAHGVVQGNADDYALKMQEIARYAEESLWNGNSMRMLPRPGANFTAGTRGIVKGDGSDYALTMEEIMRYMRETVQSQNGTLMLPKPSDIAREPAQSRKITALLPKPSEVFYAGEDGRIFRSIAEKNLTDEAEKLSRIQGRAAKRKEAAEELKKEFAERLQKLFAISGKKKTKDTVKLLQRAADEGYNGKISEETRELLFRDFFGSETVSNRNMIDHELKSQLKSIKLRISEMDAANIPDFADWRKRTMGKLGSVAKADKSNIDTVYQELSGSYPNVFPENITHPAEQLEQIAAAAEGLVYKKNSMLETMDSTTIAEMRREFDAAIDSFEATRHKIRAHNEEGMELRRIKENPRTVYHGRQVLQRQAEAEKNIFAPEELSAMRKDTGYPIYGGRQRLVEQNAAGGSMPKNAYAPDELASMQKDADYTVYNGRYRLAEREVPKKLPSGEAGDTSVIFDSTGHGGMAGAKGTAAEGKNFRIDYSEGGAAAATGKKDGKEVTRYTLSHLDKDPMEMDGVKEILNDAEFNSMDIDTRDFSAALGIKPIGFTFNKDIFRILEQASGKSKETAKFLNETIREPFEKATDGWVKELRALYKDVYAFSKKAGIKRGSRESAAAQWYREGYRLNQYGEKSPFTLADLKQEFPEKWQDIIELDKRLQPYLRSVPGRVNENLEAIYPNIEAAAWGEWNKYKAAAEKLAESARREETLIKRLEAEIAAGGEQGKILKKQAQIEKARAKLERLEKTAATKRQNAQKWEDDIVSGAIYENKRLQERANYYPHRTKKNKGFMGLKQIGEVPRDIDPRLEGISEFTRPNTKWEGFMQRRKGGYYDADALGNTLDYMPDALYKIYFDPIIANNRKVIKGIAEATKDSRNANGFINALTQWTNELAGKTNPYDRLLTFGGGRGRKLLSALNWLNNRAKSNAVMGNARSAVAQFFNLPNATIYVKNPSAWGNGAKMMADSLTNRNGAREIFDSSTFLAQRYGLDKILRKFDDGLLKTPEKLATWMLTAGDEVSTRFIWASAYHDGMRKGVTDAIRYADNITRKSVGGRGIGEIPILQNSKLYKFFIPFSLEINNSFNVLKDAVGKGDVAGLGLFMAVSYGMNSLTRENLGFDVSTDFIKAIQDGLSEWDEKEQNYMDTITGTGWKLTGELVSAIPSGAMWTKVLFRDENEREKIFGESDPSRFGTGQLGLNLITDPIADWQSGKDVSSSLLHTGLSIFPPFFGRQIERGITGAQDMGILPRVHIDKENGIAVDKKQETPGSYTDNGNLRFPIEPTWGNTAKLFAFGRYATKEGMEYIEGGNKILSENDTATYNTLVKSGVRNMLAYQFIGVIKSKEKSEEKRTEIRKTALPKEQQAILYYDLVAGEADRATMDYFKGRGTLANGKKTDMGEVYDVLSRMNEHGNKVLPKRNIIRESNLDSADKKHIYLTRVVTGDNVAKENACISKLEKSSIQIDDYLSIKNKYGMLKDQKGIDSKAEFDRWLREQGFSWEQQKAIKEEFMFWGMYPKK